MSSSPTQNRSEIAFFHLETTFPTRSIVDFGSILVCPETLVELGSYSTPVRPTDPSLISFPSGRSNVIAPDSVVYVPTFSDITDKVFDVLNGRIWAGHNILEFHREIIKKAFAEIDRPTPEPEGTIDSLALLTQKFGWRVDDMEMATFATYFGLGKQTHGSLDDVRMNLQVLKNCATILFLERSLPEILTMSSWVSGVSLAEGSSGYAGFVEPDEVSISCISPCIVPLFPRSPIRKIKLLHKDVILQLFCSRLIVRFGISTKFVDDAGRPKLSFVVDTPTSLCQVLYACDTVAQNWVLDSGCGSEWRPAVTTKYGPYPTVRLHIPTVVDGDVVQFATDIYKKEASGNVQKLDLSEFDATEIEAMLKRGSFVDAFLSLDPYNYLQSAGIRLVTERLIIHSE
ncbi:Protein NEN1-like isoform X2 [Melia azedarach]|uniref:Protein NEN1-like isoform X2 n=1 Tax=Melia azedarach TaxID=155640 RepID=A0ACC1XNR8_MELAZ|nr:Protein NEN1-like isoform X2 [Melia azedarach]